MARSPRRVRYRWTGRRESFPGEREWRFHVQSRLERSVALGRLLVTALATFLALTGRLPGGMPGPLADAVLALAWLSVAADAIMRRYLTHVAKAFPGGSALMDLLVIGAWIAATGGGASPFLPLLYVGAVSAPTRGGTAFGAFATGAYALLMALWQPASPFAVASVITVGLGVTYWHQMMMGERKHALRDPLTGVFGRGYALLSLGRIVARREFPVSVGLLDVDEFKAVNDTLGHTAGDELLQRVGRDLVETLRTTDLVARYGGDEFLLVWPRTPRREAEEIGERIQDRLSRLTGLRSRDGKRRIGVSIGITEVGAPMSLTAIVREADAALYRQKGARKRNTLRSPSR